MNNSPTEIVIGSALCPPTIWHHAIVKALLKIQNIEKIRVVPSGPRYDKVYTLSNDIRRRLIDAFVAEFEDSRVVADFTFFESETQTTTLGMDQYYRDLIWQSPYQVFGADVVKTMETWPNSPVDKKYLLEEMPKIFLIRQGVEMNLEWRWNYQLMDAVIPNASSTLVREQGRIDLLTEKVRDVYLWLNLDKNFR
jgi:nicotinic acid mononucleotide adenylyltransferase